TMIFFFQAEDGIRAFHVTGVQTCALPICDCSTSGSRATRACSRDGAVLKGPKLAHWLISGLAGTIGAAMLPGADLLSVTSCRVEIGRASCRERVENCALQCNYQQ